MVARLVSCSCRLISSSWTHYIQVKKLARLSSKIYNRFLMCCSFSVMACLRTDVLWLASRLTHRRRPYFGPEARDRLGSFSPNKNFFFYVA